MNRATVLGGTLDQQAIRFCTTVVALYFAQMIYTFIASISITEIASNVEQCSVA
jgi:hypothetical protein